MSEVSRPSITEAQIDKLVADHKIPRNRILEPDPRARYKADRAKTLSEAVYEAAFAYSAFERAQGYDGADSLLKIKKPAMALIDLLTDETNERRLVADEIDGRSIAMRLDEMVVFLRDVIAVAPRAHRTRSKGRPPNEPLEAAYKVLSKWYMQQFGREAFTNGWDTEDPRIPTSCAACFLYDVLKLIDPEQPVGALRELIAKTVKESSGPRRGRRRTGLRTRQKEKPGKANLAGPG